MTSNAQRVFQEALTLSASERAELAEQLLASLDHAESDVEAAWAAEIDRRAADARLHPNDDHDWRTVLAEILLTPASPASLSSPGRLPRG